MSLVRWDSGGLCTVFRTIALEELPIVKEGDDLAEFICSGAERSGVGIEDSDVVVIPHVVVSRVEGSLVNIDAVEHFTIHARSGAASTFLINDR
jgi:F420-0:gamma-glutamyl ligase